MQPSRSAWGDEQAATIEQTMAGSSVPAFSLPGSLDYPSHRRYYQRHQCDAGDCARRAKKEGEQWL